MKTTVRAPHDEWLVLTGYIGLLAAILVGVGEFLLHFDDLARFSQRGYVFMQAASDERQTIGHFFGVLGAPLYIIGCWHIYLMLRPADKRWALAAFLIGAYGFMIGADWISSRASIGAIVHLQAEGVQVQSLVGLYESRYESLLSVIRITTLVLSGIIVYLVLTGKTYYSKSRALFNPIVLLLLNFVVYLLVPSVGKFLMPIALNVGFGLFFILSIMDAKKIILKKRILKKSSPLTERDVSMVTDKKI